MPCLRQGTSADRYTTRKLILHKIQPGSPEMVLCDIHHGRISPWKTGCTAEQIHASRKITSANLTEDKVICQYNPMREMLAHFKGLTKK
jgi:hypothetical protein